MRRSRPTALLLLSFAPLISACGGSETHSSTSTSAGGSAGSGGSGGSGGGGAGGRDGAAPNCELAPKGQFTFHIHNGGTMPVKLALGCGAKSPIDLDTPDGKLGTGPGNADVCERTCDLVYTSPIPQCPGLCTDCAGGNLATVAPGATNDIAWDRRVYTPKMATPECLDPICSAGGNCAFGIAVAPKADQTGTLTICTDPSGVGVSCRTSRTVSFTIDTTPEEATIETN